MSSPLAATQRSLWLAEQVSPGTVANHLTYAVRIRDALDVAAFEAALQTVVDRHPMLRATFHELDGLPVQVVHDDVEVEFHVEAIAVWDDARLDERLVVETHARFDLEARPPVRFVLLERSDTDHVFFIVMHHLITDMWSMALLGREIAECYRLQVAASGERLPPIRYQYVDFVREEQALVESPAGAAMLDFWRGALDGAPSSIELPRDRSRPAVPSGRGAATAVDIDAPLTGGLRALAAQSSTSLFTVVLAAFQALLHRYSGQDDLVIGTIKANRRLRNARVMGCFVNPVALRADLSGNPPFMDVLRASDRTVRAAFANDAYPFRTLVEELRPLTDGSSPPFLGVAYSWQKTTRAVAADLSSSLALSRAGATSTVGGMEVETLAVPSRPISSDLALLIAEVGDELRATIEYSTDLFAAATAERMARHLRGLLTAFAADPEVRVGEVELLDSADRAELERWWSGPVVGFDRALAVPTLFERQVLLTPERLAVRFGDRHLSYEDLNAQANQLAHHLIDLGVGRGDLVGVSLERSLDMVVAVLGVMKAGAAYVPVDPSLPPRRRASMLADAAAVLVISRSDVVVDDASEDDERPAEPVVVRVLLDDHLAQLERRPTGNPGCDVTGDDLAYVIYTSGSTGRSKGVQVEHHSVVNFLRAMATRPGITADDVVLSVMSLSFDPSVFDVLLPLLHGAQTVIAPHDTAIDAAALGLLLASSRATIMQATPTTWRMLIEDGWPGSSRLNAVSGGEPLPPALADALLERCRAVWNVYGPTETTVCATTHRVLPRSGCESVPIGAPIQNTRCYVVDHHLRPMPIGLPGELCIGGEGVARGYLRQAELTMQRFVADPFESGARMYCTGDIVRMRPDGLLEHLGRADHQVKIRGHRVELGEIELALASHHAVEAAVVTTDEHGDGDCWLVAHYVTHGDRPPDSEELRRHLRAALPAYMIPAIYVAMASFPLTGGGKIDRTRLPRPPTAPLRVGEAPDDLIEAQLVDIWSEVLGQPVRIHDNFFDIGGHSLLATQIASRVRVRLGAEVSVRAVFDHPNVAMLAQYIRSSAPTKGLPNFAIRPAEHDGPLPLSVSQERMRFLHELHPDSAAYNIAGALRVRGALDIDALRVAVNDVVARHEALRTTFPIEDGAQVQRIEPSASIELEVVRRCRPDSSDPLPAIYADLRAAAQVPFRLHELPLVRFALYRIGDDDHLLFVNMHHIIGDQWSFGVLSRELSACYNARHVGVEPALPPVEIQPADYAQWHRSWIEGGAIDGQLQYWRRQLEDCPVVDLPSDHPRPPVRSGRGAMLTVPIPRRVRRGLEGLCLRFRVSPFIVLLAALDVLVHRHTGACDLVIGTAIANRNWLESESLIGSFVNTLAMRCNLSGDPTFQELVGRVQDVALDAYANQDVPFATVVNELRPERDLSRSPLFQIFLNVENAPFELPQLDELTAEVVTVDRGAAQFDLSLSIDLSVRHEATVEYSTDLFERPTVSRLVDRLWVLLEDAIDDPEVCVGKLPMLTPSDRAEQEAAWSGPARPVDDGVAVHHLFERQTHAAPERVAISCGNSRLTYAALNARANQLAHHLRAIGVERGDLVGVRLDRSLDMVVAVLGVLKSGAAYIPLDPDFPPGRLSMMLSESAAAVVVSRADLVCTLGSAGTSEPDPALVLLDRDADEISVGPSGNPVGDVTGVDLAYVIYTSGSTGRPKGVSVEHRNVVNLLQAMAVRPGISAADVLLSVTTLSFDISVLELLLPLVHGAETVIADRDTASDGRALARLLARRDATIMQATPTTWRMLVDSGWPGARRLVALCGGETMPPDLADLLLDRCRALWNLYGPTETTIWSTVHRVGPRCESGANSVPVGTPIDNTRCYVLDAMLQPLPAGVPGELYIGGQGVARGYLHRPDLTAERFLPDPFWSSGRVYRTGDLARWRLDGALEHLGRIDQQVKIRGHRVELGEIEANLLAHTDVRAAVVVADERRPGDFRLVAYYLGNGRAPNPNELRDHLRALLPAAMIPSFFVRMTAFPLTPNGKVDRRRLPPPVATAPVLHPRPQNELQAQLVDIWSDVLGIPNIGIHDDFFDLGGHSLLAIRVFAALERLTGRNVPLTMLFQAPTIAELSELLDHARLNARWTSLVPARPDGTRRPFFYVSPFRITVLSLAHLSRHLGPDQPFYAIQPQGMEGDHAIHQRIEDMAAHYIDEMRDVQPTGPYLIGGHCAGSWVAFEMARQLQAVGDDVGLLVLVDAEPPGIEQPHVGVVRYVTSRLAHYWRERRLMHSVRWQLRVLAERLVVRRVGAERWRGIALLRQAHAEAHRRYRGGVVRGDALLIRSQEWTDLPDKAWLRRWDELITGELHLATVLGSHADLVENANSAELAACIRRAIDQTDRSPGKRWGQASSRAVLATGR